MRSENAVHSQIWNRHSLATPIDVALLIVAPYAAMIFAGCAYHWVHMTFLVWTDVGPLGLVYSPYITLTPLLAICSWYGASRNAESALSAAVGTVIALVATVNFRGSFYWPGTFDARTIPFPHTVIPVIVGFCLGMLLSSRKPLSMVFGRYFILTITLIALCWSWVDANRDIGIYSLSPYSAHLALTDICGVAVVVGLLVRGATK